VVGLFQCVVVYTFEIRCRQTSFNPIIFLKKNSIMTVHPLPEGTFTVGHDKLYAPFNLKKEELTERSTGSLLVEVQPFLLLTENEVILLDAGLGFNSAEGKLMIHENLAKLGFNSSDVTKILMSHLHKDHAGGLVSQNAQGEFEL